MKGNNQGIELFNGLIDQVADSKDKLIEPGEFIEQCKNAYSVLLDELQAYLLEGGVYHLNRYEELSVKLGLVRNRIDSFIELNAEGKQDIDPYNTSLGLYVNSKLNDALVLIHPDNTWRRMPG